MTRAAAIALAVPILALALSAALAIPPAHMRHMLRIASRADATPGEFSPLDIEGCIGWWDAADSATVQLDGTAVTNWIDKSGSGRHASATGAARPTATTNGIVFAGGMWLALAETFSSSGATFFAVMSCTNTTVGFAQGGYPFGAVGGTRPRPIGQRNDRLYWALSGGYITYQKPVSSTLLYAHTQSHDGAKALTAQVFRVDGDQKAVDGSLAQSFETTVDALGRQGAEYHAGVLAELAAFSRSLTLEEIEMVETYLMKKWGIK